MLKRATNLRVAQLRRRHTAACLKWPLGEKDKLSQRLLDVEAHWKPKLDAEAAASWSKPTGGEKKYVLSMFPYPSGNLHMGHMRVYTISDVTARYYRLNGFDVVHPIGWDSFGLPAENAARERGVDPREWTRSNIASMTNQLLKTGVQFDWTREISTCEPEFYRWTQWIFCRLHERGLLRRNLAEVNWDPVDGTVLAAEQIDHEGRSWRSGALAEKRKLRQWMVETPKYAKRLSDGLKKVSQWHEVADIQSNWIGACDVYRFKFPLRDSAHHSLEELLDLRVHDALSISSAWFIVLKQGHPLSDATKSETKEPYRLPISALNGVTADWMPIIVVPKDYDGPQMYLDSRVGDTVADASLISQFDLKPQRRVMSMNLDDVQEIAAFGDYGGYLTSRSLHDWVVSRQRAWGTPIPMILSEDGRQAVPVEDSKLPLIQGLGREKVVCDRFKEGYGFYEADTLDTFFDSAWYYLRYLDPHNSEKLISKEAASRMPVDVYVGGIEHAAVHMFFARFISHFLTDIGATSMAEPFRHLIPQGIVKGKTYIEASSGKYLRNDEVVFGEDGSAKSKEGAELEVVFEKMSKSKHNGVDPLLVLERDGVDLTRLQLLDAAAPRQPVNWGETDLKGIRKWMDRVAWVVNNYVEQQKSSGKEAAKVDPKIEVELKEAYNFFVRNVSMCLEVLNLHNTGLMRLIGFTNALRKVKPEVLASSPEAERCIHALLTMMQVYAPHAANEMYSAVQDVVPTFEGSLYDQKWPQVDEDCSIDFMLYIDNISCGRYPVPRKEIEQLGLQELIQRSQNGEHKAFIDKLRAKGADLKDIQLNSREGFHVTLNATLVGAEDSKVIGTVLDELQAEYTAAKKKARKPDAKKKKSVNA